MAITPNDLVGSLSIMLILGILISILSTKIKIPNMFLLIIFGMVLTIPALGYNLEAEFPVIFISSLALITLIIIIFEGATQFSFNDFDEYSLASIRLFFIFLFLCIIFLTPLTYYFFPGSWYYALFFSIIMTATAAEIILLMFKVSPNKAVNILKFESVLNDTFIILLPIMLINFMIGTSTQVNVSEQVKLFFLQIVVGLGAGILGWLLFFKTLKIHINENYIKNLSQISLMVAALVIYALTERLQGSGILAVTIFGLFVGNSYIAKQFDIEGFTPYFINLFEILVFILAGIIIKVPFTDVIFILKAFGIYAFFTFLRYIAVDISFRNTVTNKEKWFMTLAIPKGISTATLVLLVATYNLPGIDPILDLIMFSVLLSILIGTVTGRFTDRFLDHRTSQKA